MSASESFLSAFSQIIGTGNFHSAGAAPFFFPQLRVAGLGEISFPLPKAQAKELIAIAEAAPHGQGNRTVLDESVRKCWQIDAADFAFDSPQWKKHLEQVLVIIREDLGITGKISAKPYKLLIYGPGGHFKAHRDTEKLAAMFGTLVIALPSQHAGGKLFIRHDGREFEVDFSREEHRHDFQYAAFFADCEHEVVPVSAGYRCCVVYNLHLDKGDPEQLNLSLTAQARTLLPSLLKLKREQAGELRAVLLEHSYTEANLSLRKLKGNDQTRAHALLAAANEAGFSAHLALATFHQMGELDEYDARRRSRYDDDDDPTDGTMGEVYDEDLTLSDWRDARDRKVEPGTFGIDRDLLITSEPFGEGEPDEQEAEGYTGNAGCTMDYWYRRAAIVLWANEDEEEILCRYNLRGASARLGKLAAAKNTGPGSPFHRLATAVVARCPDAQPRIWEHTWHPELCNDPLYLTLDALATAGAGDLLERLLKHLPAAGLAVCDSPLWSKLHAAFGAETFDPACAALLDEPPQPNRRPLFLALDSLTKREDADRSRRIAVRLAALGPRPPQPRYSRDAYRDPAPVGDCDEARILLAASRYVETARDRRTLRAFLEADSSLGYIREILGPVLLEKASAKLIKQANSQAPEILAFAIKLLAAETARPLTPFPDWTRPCPPFDPTPDPYRFQPSNPQKPDPIAELEAFMADPHAATHHFVRAQGDRDLLDAYILRHSLDLDCITIEKGRPYTLACTKNDKSHQHALALRAGDQAMLDKLLKLQARTASELSKRPRF